MLGQKSISVASNMAEHHILNPNQPEQKGLGILTAAIFLSGEMAGSGVLALPNALVGTGWSGMLLILFFSINAAYIGTRLGLCWEILSELGFDEFSQNNHVRDPYPLIAEKSGSLKGYRIGKALRYLASACIIITLYGSACVFIILISDFITELSHQALSKCLWMVIVAVTICPLTWFGTPKDFWPIAIGALLTTCTACILTMIQIPIDVQENNVVLPPNNLNCSAQALDSSSANTTTFKPMYPSLTFGTYMSSAFGSIMFAFGGASTFPTIQADMKDKNKFKVAAILAMIMLFLIYFPTAVVGYFTLGECVEDNVIMSMSNGILKTAAECIILLHLVAALPIIINPPSQFFEELLHIPQEFNWKRCAFRTLIVGILLFIAESVPSFGSILDLVGGSTITCLTFVLPPLLYIFVMDHSEQRTLLIWERLYCWFLIIIGLVGGFTATYTAVKNIIQTELATPCYMNI